MIKSLFFISLTAIEVDVQKRRGAKLYPELLVFAIEERGTAGVNKSSGGL